MMTSSEQDPSFDALVDRTHGLQPWRRLFHALTGVVIAFALTWTGLQRWTATGILAGILVGALAVDLLRLKVSRLNEIFFRHFSGLVSPREAQGIASSTWYMLGATLVVALFHGPAAVSGILVLALADPAASYVGRRWGERPFLAGTVEGSAVFALVALAILLPRHPLMVALPAAVVAVLAERLSWPLDDNISVPVATAAVIVGLGAIL